MKQLVDGVYHNGHIDINEPLPLEESAKVKVLIMTEDREQSAELGIYNLGKELDKINIRDFAHED